jgi:hypothetical protein
VSKVLSYLETLHGIVSEDEMEGLLGLVQAHKNWGAFRVRNLTSHTVVNLIDEIKRLREAAGTYKTVPEGIDPLEDE